MGSSLSGLTYTLSLALKLVATTPSLGFTVNICSAMIIMHAGLDVDSVFPPAIVAG